MSTKENMGTAGMTSGAHDQVHQGDWLVTGVLVSAYLAFMVVIAIAPKWAAAPIAAGTPLSNGLVAGIGLIVATVIVAANYTHRRNR